MVQSHSPSYDPQRFTFRFGACIIDNGKIRFDVGPARFLRQINQGLRETDPSALKNPVIGIFGVVSLLWTMRTSVIDILTGGEWWLSLTALVGVASLAWHSYGWVKLWLIDPTVIRCSDVENVSINGKKTIEITYKNGPRQLTQELTLSGWNTDSSRQNAIRAFEQKGFEVEQCIAKKWYHVLT